MPTASFDRGVLKPDHVVMRELEGEAVLLNLRTETYFGLDEVGTRIWTELAAGGSVDGACEALQEEFEVDPGVLRGDIEKLVSELLGSGLLELAPAEEPLDAVLLNGAVPDGPPGEAAAPTLKVSRSVS